MKQTIIAFTGISGVGKTTFLRKLMEWVPFQHLTAGSLIVASRATINQDRDNLKHANLDENQVLLIRGFMQAKEPKTAVIILDGHMIIDTGDRLVDIASQVFRELGVNLIVHLEAEPSQIRRNRTYDEKRRRPILSVDALQEHQKKSQERARSVAQELGIEFIALGDADLDSFVDCVRRYAREVQTSEG